MSASIASITTRGFGSYGDVALITLLGYQSGEAPPPPMASTQQDLLVLARLLRLDDDTYDMVAATASDVESITRTIVSLADGTTVEWVDSIAVTSGTVLPALSTGDVWNLDTVGFNFLNIVPGARLETPGGSIIRYEIVLTDGVIVKLPEILYPGYPPS